MSYSISDVYGRTKVAKILLNRKFSESGDMAFHS